MCVRVGGEHGVGTKGQKGSARTLSNTHTHRLTLPPSPPLPSPPTLQRGEDMGRGLPVQTEAGRQTVGRGRTDWAKGRRGKNSRETRRQRDGDFWGRDKQCLPVVSLVPVVVPTLGALI